MPRSGWAYTDLGYFNELGGMTGSVQFRTDCNSLSGSTNFVFASSSNRVGIRYDLTQPGFDIQRGSTALPLYHPNAALEVRGDMNVTGSIYAKNYYIQNVSFVDLTGSTKFGDSSGDTHKFIGSMGIGVDFATPSGVEPSSVLHIMAEHPKITMQANAANGDSQFLFKSANGTQLANFRCDTTSNALNHFGMSAGTSEDHLVIDSTGYIGIGTTSPQELLHLKSSVSYKPELLIENSNSDAVHSILRFYKSTTDEAAGDDVGAIFWTGKDAADSDADMAWILGAASTDISAGAEEGVIHMGVASAGAASTSTLTLVGQGSANTTYAYFGDPASGGTTKVGIGVVDPDSPLEVFSTSTQQKWSYDSNSFATFTVAADSHTTLATGEDGNFTLDAEGDIVLDADGGNIYLKDAGATYIEFQIDGTNDKMVVNGGLTIDASDDIVLDADGDQISMKFGGSNGQIDFSNANSGDGIIRQMVDAKDLVIQQYDGTEVVRFGDDRKLYFYDKGGEYLNSDGTNLTIASGNDIVCSIPANSALEPSLDNVSDLGSASKRWANLYTGDLHLKNDRGDWTVVEESEYLTLVNNANGKKYKIMMEEIED